MASITQRRLEITGNIHIKDGEWPGTDEICNEKIKHTVTLKPNGKYEIVFTKVLKCGGECRTELNIEAKLKKNGEILVNVFTRFYEGASDDTDELEGSKSTKDLLVPIVDITSLTHHIIHDDIPDDETIVSLEFANRYTQWSPVISSGNVVAIHAALVPTENGDGEILLFGGDNHDHAAALAKQFDHSARFNCRHPDQALIPVRSPDFDVFCCGHSFLADGRLMVAGGTEKFVQDAGGIHVGVHFEGHRHSAAYDPISCTFSNLADMGPEPGHSEKGGGRWYPTLCTLETGEVYVFQGHPLGSDGRHGNNTPERYRSETNSWVILPEIGNVDADPILYSRLHLVNDGRVFVTSRINGYNNNILINPATSAVQEVSPLPDVDYHGYASPSVMLPLVPEDEYRARFLLCGGRTSQFLDLEKAGAGWQNVPRDGAITSSRFNSNATLLPTGDILLTGGTLPNTKPNDQTGVMRPEIYRTPLDRATLTYSNEVGQWKTIYDEATVLRNYHSSALLMPDGRVWTAGGNAAQQPGKPPTVTQKQIEIFDPPYPDGARPTITSGQSMIEYGEDFIIRSPQADIIGSIVLMRCGSSTHAFDSDQRAVYLRFRTEGGDQLIATAPPNGKIAPPGSYMVFIVDQSGRPCQYARFVSLGGPHRISKSLDIARRHLNLSSQLASEGQHAKAVIEAQAAVDELRGFEPPLDKKKEYLELLAFAWYYLANVLILAGRGSEAVKPAREAVQLYLELIGASGADVSTIASNLLSLSIQLSYTARLYAEAAKTVQVAVEMLRRIQPAHMDLFASTLYYLANFLILAERGHDAIEPAEEAVRVYKQLAVESGADVSTIASNLLSLSIQLSYTARLYAEATKTVQAAVEMLRRIQPAHMDLFASTLYYLANFLILAERGHDAIEPAEEAVRVYKQLAVESGANVSTIASNLLSLSIQLSYTARLYAEATKTVQAAVEMLRKIQPAHMDLFASTLYYLANFLILAERGHDAIEPAEEAVRVYKQLAVESGADVSTIASNLLSLSIQLSYTARLYAEAAKTVQAAVEMLRRIQPAHMDLFASTLYYLAVFLQTDGHDSEAIPTAREAVQVYRRLAQEDPDKFGPLLQQAEQLLASFN
ncbi:tetratricopeptide repeat protein [Bacillus cereus]|nr:tetratricopeptide repeat protein [Bacillus cereus]